MQLCINSTAVKNCLCDTFTPITLSFKHPNQPSTTFICTWSPHHNSTVFSEPQFRKIAGNLPVAAASTISRTVLLPVLRGSTQTRWPNAFLHTQKDSLLSIHIGHFERVTMNMGCQKAPWEMLEGSELWSRWLLVIALRSTEWTSYKTISWAEYQEYYNCTQSFPCEDLRGHHLYDASVELNCELSFSEREYKNTVYVSMYLCDKYLTWAFFVPSAPIELRCELCVNYC